MRVCAFPSISAVWLFEVGSSREPVSDTLKKQKKEKEKKV